MIFRGTLPPSGEQARAAARVHGSGPLYFRGKRVSKLVEVVHLEVTPNLVGMLIKIVEACASADRTSRVCDVIVDYGNATMPLDVATNALMVVITQGVAEDAAATHPTASA